MIRWLGPGGLLVGLALVMGCQSGPQVTPVPGYAAHWLGGTPRVVVRLDATQVTAWGHLTRSRDALKAVGDRTRTVWLGFDLEHLDDLHTASSTVRIVLEGDFPRGLAGLLLDWNQNWKKGGSPGLWTNPKLDLSVSLPQDGIVTARRHDATLPEATPGVLRDLDPRALERSALWATFWDPGQALFGAAGASLLHVERLDVILTARGDVLEGPVVLQFGDDRAARAATVLLKLFSTQIRSRLGQDLLWTNDGSRIVGESLRIKQADLEALAEKLVTDPSPQEATP